MFQTRRLAQRKRHCPKRGLMSEKEYFLSANGQRRTIFKPKPNQSPGMYLLINRVAHATRKPIILCERDIPETCSPVTRRAAYDEILEGRQLSTWPVLCCRSGDGVPPPPLPIYILYLYGYPKRGQNEGIFPAFEDALRVIERRASQSTCPRSMALSSKRSATNPPTASRSQN